MGCARWSVSWMPTKRSTWTCRAWHGLLRYAITPPAPFECTSSGDLCRRARPANRDGERHESLIGQLGRVTAPVLFLLLLAACAGNNPADESAPASDEASPTSTESTAPPSEPSEPSEPASESPSATASAEQSEGASGLTIPREFPCDSIDETTVEELIGGVVGLTREWEPGDQPFGDQQPPSTNFGCQYVAEGGPSSASRW